MGQQRTSRIPFKKNFELSVWLSRKSFRKDLEIMEKEPKFR